MAVLGCRYTVAFVKSRLHREVVECLDSVDALSAVQGAGHERGRRWSMVQCGRLENGASATSTARPAVDPERPGAVRWRRQHPVSRCDRRGFALLLQPVGVAAGALLQQVHSRRERDAANGERRDDLHDDVQRHRLCGDIGRCVVHHHSGAASTATATATATAVCTADQRVGGAADSVLVLDRSGLDEPDHELPDADEEFGRSRMALHDGGFAVAVVELGFEREVMECDYAFRPCPPLSGPGNECERGRCVVQRCRVDLELMERRRGSGRLLRVSRSP